MLYQPGDILFYAAVKGSLEDSIISHWTDSPFVHVAIATTNGFKIEALSGGVVATLIDDRPIAALWSYQDHAQPVVQANLQQALTWLSGQLHLPYGWSDIFNAFLHKWEQGLFIDEEDHFDCSALACEFLLKAGGIAALEDVTDAHIITPALLARRLGVVTGGLATA